MPIAAVELLRALDRVLAGHGVRDVEHLASAAAQRLQLAASSVISSSSMCRRPAVSTISEVVADGARLVERRAQDARAGVGRARGMVDLQPRPGRRWSRSCSRAAGRYTSVETRSGWLPAPWSASAPSLAEVVVLPEPCRPGHQDHGGQPRRGLRARGGSSPPSSSTISSRTMRMHGLGRGEALAGPPGPSRVTRTRSRNSLATLKWTSASSRARRISRRAASTSASPRTPARGGCGTPPGACR